MALFNLKKREEPVRWSWAYWENQVSHTPDFWQLEQQPYHLVFLYGNTMKNHKYWQGQDAVCTAFTRENYSVWKKRLGEESYPVALENPIWVPIESYKRRLKNVESHPIRGELYRLTPKQILGLDKHHGNTVQFSRQMVNLVIPLRGVKFVDERDVWEHHLARGPLPKAIVNVPLKPRIVEAWMYVGVSDYWTAPSAGLFISQVRRFKPNNPDLDTYYMFTPKEYVYK